MPNLYRIAVLLASVARACAKAVEAPVEAPPQSKVGSDNGPSTFATRTSKTTLSHMTDLRFDDLSIDDRVKRAIREVMGYTTCTEVQKQALPQCLGPKDVVVKAKTGTGKTIAFLVPAISKVIQSNKEEPGTIPILVISPTRELAQQISEEAKALTKFLPKWGTQCVVGGTNIQTDINKLKKQAPHILVATPGRLNDLLENAGLKSMCRKLQVLIFDEADQLLDMGFRPAITQALSMLPPPSARQAFLFSATFPSAVTSFTKNAVGPDYVNIDTVGEDDATNRQVDQFHCVAPNVQLPAYLWSLLTHEKAEDPLYKAIVFFPTARAVQFYSELFERLNFRVLEMHSRKSQSYRGKTADQFRDGSGITMFTSDVSARGMDYPDVTLVIQFNLPSDVAQYTHRLGRTGRAGKAGRGVLLLADFEKNFLKQVSDLPINPLPVLSAQDCSEFRAMEEQGNKRMTEKTCEQAYQSWLGFYNSNLKMLRWDKTQLVREANAWYASLGRSQPPALRAKTVGMMGLRGTPGIRVEGKNGVPRADPRVSRSGGQSPSRARVVAVSDDAADFTNRKQRQPDQDYQNRGRGAGKRQRGRGGNGMVQGDWQNQGGRLSRDRPFPGRSRAFDNGGHFCGNSIVTPGRFGLMGHYIPLHPLQFREPRPWRPNFVVSAARPHLRSPAGFVMELFTQTSFDVFSIVAVALLGLFTGSTMICFCSGISIKSEQPLLIV